MKNIAPWYDHITAEEEAPKRGLEEKSKESVEKGAEFYAKVRPDGPRSAKERT